MKGHDDVQEKSSSSEHQDERRVGLLQMDSDHVVEVRVRLRGSDPILGPTESHSSFTYGENGSTGPLNSLSTR